MVANLLELNNKAAKSGVLGELRLPRRHKARFRDPVMVEGSDAVFIVLTYVTTCHLPDEVGNVVERTPLGDDLPGVGGKKPGSVIFCAGIGRVIRSFVAEVKVYILVGDYASTIYNQRSYALRRNHHTRIL